MKIANDFVLENTLFIHTHPLPNQVNVTIHYKSIETTVISLGKKIPNPPLQRIINI